MPVNRPQPQAVWPDLVVEGQDHGARGRPLGLTNLLLSTGCKQDNTVRSVSSVRLACDWEGGNCRVWCSNAQNPSASSYFLIIVAGPAAAYAPVTVTMPSTTGCATALVSPVTGPRPALVATALVARIVPQHWTHMLAAGLLCLANGSDRYEWPNHCVPHLSFAG